MGTATEVAGIIERALNHAAEAVKRAANKEVNRRKNDFDYCQKNKQCECGRLFDINIPYLDTADSISIQGRCDYCDVHQVFGVPASDFKNIYGYLARLLFSLKRMPRLVHALPRTLPETLAKKWQWSGFGGI